MLLKEKRTIYLNPKYSELQDFINELPSIFDAGGEVIHSGRNVIKVFDVGKLRVNVKRYRIPPYFINRIVYCLLREPKSVRAYHYAIKISQLGITTPEPIAYIYFRTACFFNYSYFISIQRECTYDIREIEEKPFSEEVASVWKQMAIFTANLHENGIYHYDYKRGNILYDIKDEKCEFALYDINRMSFGDVSLEKGCANFNRLRIQNDAVSVVAEAYAGARGFDKDDVYKRILKARAINKALGESKI